MEIQESPREFLLDGTIEAINRSTISAQTSGQVEEILLDVDDYVDQGDVLIVLKDTEQKLVFPSQMGTVVPESAG